MIQLVVCVVFKFCDQIDDFVIGYVVVYLVYVVLLIGFEGMVRYLCWSVILQCGQWLLLFEVDLFVDVVLNVVGCVQYLVWIWCVVFIYGGVD